MGAKKILEAFLELLLPRPESVKVLEAMTPEALRKRAASGHPTAHTLSPNTLFLFDYGHPLVRQAVWELKYRGNKKIGRLLAECLYEELVETLAEEKLVRDFERPLLIFIPLSGKRERKRGWNQCGLLADELEKLDGGRFFERGHNLLTRIRDTESQTNKNRAARLQNLKDCFATPAPEKISGRHVIILDDVTTTGATFDEARRTLRRSGARKILCIAVAH